MNSERVLYFNCYQIYDPSYDDTPHLRIWRIRTPYVLTLNIEPSTLDVRIDSSLCNTSH